MPAQPTYQPRPLLTDPRSIGGPHAAVLREALRLGGAKDLERGRGAKLGL